MAKCPTCFRCTLCRGYHCECEPCNGPGRRRDPILPLPFEPFPPPPFRQPSPPPYKPFPPLPFDPIIGVFRTPTGPYGLPPEPPFGAPRQIDPIGGSLHLIGPCRTLPLQPLDGLDHSTAVHRDPFTTSSGCFH